MSGDRTVYIAYYDESGDDGYPQYSSPLFALSACYLHYLNWKETFDNIRAFRRELKNLHGIPVDVEFHSRYFLLNKNPYRSLALTDQARHDVVDAFCGLVAQLNVLFVNVVIAKHRIKNPGYEVLDTAFKYSIQRIENDLNPTQNPGNKFLIITDPGRAGKMRATARRIQRVNFIPSRFGPAPLRREIQALIEDPLPKDSKESHFIQLCDLVSYLTYLHCSATTGIARFPKRMPRQITPTVVGAWMDKLKPVLNLKASASDPHGIVIHPR